MKLPPSREYGLADNATKNGLREGEQGRHRAHASYSWAASSRTSPSSSMVSVMRLGRQQTAQSSVKVCRRPPLGSTKMSLSSPQNAQLYVTRCILRAMMPARTDSPSQEEFPTMDEQPIQTATGLEYV